ncbi:MAG: hypothetical protein M0R66_00430 [Candidatus Omnitrophica bacterium]|nr:hypothetical protein [Candidatus Omnitrophota bacterium]
MRLILTINENIDVRAYEIGIARAWINEFRDETAGDAIIAPESIARDACASIGTRVTSVGARVRENRAQRDIRNRELRTIGRSAHHRHRTRESRVEFSAINKRSRTLGRARDRLQTYSAESAHHGNHNVSVARIQRVIQRRNRARVAREKVRIIHLGAR